MPKCSKGGLLDCMTADKRDTQLLYGQSDCSCVCGLGLVAPDKGQKHVDVGHSNSVPLRFSILAGATAGVNCNQARHYVGEVLQHHGAVDLHIHYFSKYPYSPCAVEKCSWCRNTHRHRRLSRGLLPRWQRCRRKMTRRCAQAVSVSHHVGTPIGARVRGPRAMQRGAGQTMPSHFSRLLAPS